MEHYLPGCNAGGALRSVANLVDTLGDEFDFKIITRDRDLGSNEPYPGVKPNDWQSVGKAEVFYVSPGNVSWLFMRRLINASYHDIIYLNSFFSPGFTIFPLVLRGLGLIPQKRTIIAPEGEFSPGALKVKPFKKKLFIYLAKTIALYRNVVWRASSSYEEVDIRVAFEKPRRIDSSIPIVVAPDLPNPVLPAREREVQEKKPGYLKVVFLSRISPKKNLDGALRMLSGLSGDVTFNIYGPVEDRDYWEKCQKIIGGFPANIHVYYKGKIDHDAVTGVLSENHVFFFPTHGENYGHVIFEALVAGCPILISNQTPWRDLEAKGVGWDLPLGQPQGFTETLQQCVNMGNGEWRALSQHAREYGVTNSNNQEGVQRNRVLFSMG